MRKSLFKGLLVAGIAILALFGACDSMFFSMAEEGGPPGEYTVTYDTIGAGTIDQDIVEPGGTVSKPPNPTAPSTLGGTFTFGGWFTSLTFDPATEFFFMEDTNPTPVNRNITLYALWRWPGGPDNGKITISFDANGGTNPPDNINVFRGQNISIPPEPTSPSQGERLKIWNTESDGTGIDLNDSTRIRVLVNTKYFAVWTTDPVETFKVTFYFDGGTTTHPSFTSDIVEITVNKDDSVDAPDPTPTKEHYTFVGWFSDSALTLPYTGWAVGVTADLNLYAKWDPIKYKINFISNDGSGAPQHSSSEGEHDKYVNFPGRNTLTYLHHTFEGWKTDSDGSDAEYDEDDTTVEFSTFSFPGTNEITLYAHWEAITYRVNFDLNDGMGENIIGNDTGKHNEHVEFPDGSTLTPPSGLLVFDGWKIVYDGSKDYEGEFEEVTFGEIFKDITPNEIVIKLFVHWKSE